MRDDDDDDDWFSVTLFVRLSKLSLKAVMHTVSDVISYPGNVTTQQSLAFVPLFR